MTEISGSNRRLPRLTEAFDWRAKRTWVAYLGTALTFGTINTAIVLTAVFINQVLGLTAVWARWAAGIAVIAVLFGIVLYVMDRLIKEAATNGGRGGKTTGSGLTVSRRSSWLDLTIEGLWYGLAHAPFLALPEAPGDKEDVAFMTIFLVTMNLVGLFCLPEILVRWAKWKARPDR